MKTPIYAPATNTVILLTALLLMTNVHAFPAETVEFCGFNIEIPLGWTVDSNGPQNGSALSLKPRCWCELLHLPQNADQPPEFWFVKQPTAPVKLHCTSQAVDDFLANGSTSFQRTDTGFKYLGETAWDVEGDGWFGIGIEYEVRQYYWLGGNAGSRREYSAILYGLTGTTMEIWILNGEDGFVLSHISHP